MPFVSITLECAIVTVIDDRGRFRGGEDEWLGNSDELDSSLNLTLDALQHLIILPYPHLFASYLIIRLRSPTTILSINLVLPTHSAPLRITGISPANRWFEDASTTSNVSESFISI